MFVWKIVVVRIASTSSFGTSLSSFGTFYDQRYRVILYHNQMLTIRFNDEGVHCSVMDVIHSISKNTSSDV